jgi:hypothetical protein
VSDAVPPSSPVRAARVFAALLAARAIFGLVYIAVAVGRLPILWYHPLEHTWELTGHPSGLAMGWYGTTLAALLAAALGGGITFAAGARGPLSRALARGAVILALARAGGMILLVDFVYFGWALTHQTPKPLAGDAPP